MYLIVKQYGMTALAILGTLIVFAGFMAILGFGVASGGEASAYGNGMFGHYVAEFFLRFDA